MRALLLSLLGLVIAVPVTPLLAEAPGPTVFAAASLTDALKDVAAAWRKAGHPPLQLSFASSSLLARQIEQGAPANLFASADEQWMDYLAKAGLIVPESRVDLLSNRLVLVVPKDRARTIKIGPDINLTDLLGTDGRLAVADPAHVPAGIYAKQALTKFGLWPKLVPRLAHAENVRAALLLVERGEALAGIVYATDAAVSPGVTVAGTFPECGFITNAAAIENAGDDADQSVLAMRFRDANTTHDGHLTREQARAARMRMVVQNFDAIDRTHKGYVTLDDLRRWRRTRPAHSP